MEQIQNRSNPNAVTRTDINDIWSAGFGVGNNSGPTPDNVPELKQPTTLVKQENEEGGRSRSNKL